MSIHIENKPWFSYLDEDIQESLKLSVQLAEVSAEWSRRYHDYSFLVFPAAKAYEGFLKNLFLDMGFISKEQYKGKRFRIGKALNPHLDKKYQDDGWVYDEISKYCGGPDLADTLWKTWKESRNVLFHWFPDEKNVVTHNEAVERLLAIIGAMDEVYTACEVDLTNVKK